MENQLVTINHPMEAARIFEDIWCPRDLWKDKGTSRPTWICMVPMDGAVPSITGEIHRRHATVHRMLIFTDHKLHVLEI